MDLVVVETELEAFVCADNFQHQKGVWLLENHHSKQGNSGAIVAQAMVTPNDRSAHGSCHQPNRQTNDDS